MQYSDPVTYLLLTVMQENGQVRNFAEHIASKSMSSAQLQDSTRDHTKYVQVINQCMDIGVV